MLQDRKVVKFTSPLPPSVNHYLSKRVAFSNGKPYVQVYESDEAKAYKKYMRKVLKRALEEYSWEKTGEFTYIICEMEVFLSQKHRDADNLQKCLFDSVNENNIAYDDSMIIPRVSDIFIDTENPRIEVTIYVSEKKGVFKNEEQYIGFVRFNCSSCTRANRNCSIMRKTLENRITKEINVQANTCSAYKKKKG